MRYTIDENDNFAVRVFADGDEVPFLYQPNYPNGDSFDSYQEAETWAQYAINALIDENAPYAPGGKNEPPSPKPTAEELAAALKQLYPNDPTLSA